MWVRPCQWRCHREVLSILSQISQRQSEGLGSIGDYIPGQDPFQVLLTTHTALKDAERALPVSAVLITLLNLGELMCLMMFGLHCFMNAQTLWPHSCLIHFMIHFNQNGGSVHCWIHCCPPLPPVNWLDRLRTHIHTSACTLRCDAVTLHYINLTVKSCLFFCFFCFSTDCWIGPCCMLILTRIKDTKTAVILWFSPTTFPEFSFFYNRHQSGVLGAYCLQPLLLLVTFTLYFYTPFSSQQWVFLTATAVSKLISLVQWQTLSEVQAIPSSIPKPYG